ncbi:MAG: hypothetical protein PVG75_06795 [Thioalkalispiraceae bacterium]|jgi:hypothetical protein
MMKHILIFISCLSLSGPLLAEESLEMEGTRIRGNQELPKVLYIVPWKRSEIPDLSQPPLESLIDEALAPVDREVFQRKIRYYDSLSTQEVGSNEN